MKKSLFVLLLALPLAIWASVHTSSLKAAVVTEKQYPTTNIPKPKPNYDLFGGFSAAEEAAYDVDCNNRRNEKRGTIHGNVVLNNPHDSEHYRCVRVIYGDLIVNASDYGNIGNRVKKYVLPYLQRVSEDVRLQGAAIMQQVRLPKLYSIGGRLRLDYRRGDVPFRLDSLIGLNGELEVTAGPVNSFVGMESLTSVGDLVLRTDPQDFLLNNYGTSYCTGLPAVTKIKSDLEVKLYWGQESANFLPALDQIQGDVHFVIDEGYFIGVRHVTTIGGNLDVEWNENYSGSTQGFTELLTIGGNIIWDGPPVYNLSGFQTLVSVGGEFNLPLSVSSLSDLAKLDSIGRLTIEDAYYLTSLNGLSGVNHLGHLTLDNNNSLTGVSALLGATMPSTGTIRITNNPNLSNCSAQSLVKDLRNDPNWSSWNTSSTLVAGNKNCFKIYRKVLGISLR